MSDKFIDRVFDKMFDALTHADHFTHTAWKYDDRPTKEAVGRLPAKVDVDAMVARILDVEQYPGNVQYVEHVEVLDRQSDSDITFMQRVDIPLLGGLQTAIRVTDIGERKGFRVVWWHQDDAATDALDKKHGARTDYNLGAWILKPDEVLYALSSAPRKKDVGTLKYAVMTRGAEATIGEVLRNNIEGMVEWSQRQ